MTVKRPIVFVPAVLSLTLTCPATGDAWIEAEVGAGTAATAAAAARLSSAGPARVAGIACGRPPVAGREGGGGLCRR